MKARVKDLRQKKYNEYTERTSPHLNYSMIQLSGKVIEVDEINWASYRYINKLSAEIRQCWLWLDEWLSFTDYSNEEEL
jgi:hypothetical protein